MLSSISPACIIHLNMEKAKAPEWAPCERTSALALRRDDVHDLLLDDASVEVGLAAAAEGDLAHHHRVEGVVMADLHVLAGLYLRAALADDDHARAGRLAVSELNPEVLRVRVI